MIDVLHSVARCLSGKGLMAGTAAFVIAAFPLGPAIAATISVYAEYAGSTGSVPGSGVAQSDTEYKIFAKPEGVVETAPAGTANQDGQLGAATTGSLGSLAIASWKETVQNDSAGATKNTLQFGTGDFGMSANSIWRNDGNAFFDVELTQGITYDVLVNDNVIWTSALEITSKSFVSDVGSSSPEAYFDLSLGGVAPNGAFAPFGYPDALIISPESDFFRVIVGYAGTGSEYQLDLGDLGSGESLTVEYRLTVSADSTCAPVSGLGLCEGILFPHVAGAGFTGDLFLSGDPSGFARVVSKPVEQNPAPVPLPPTLLLAFSGVAVVRIVAGSRERVVGRRR